MPRIASGKRSAAHHRGIHRFGFYFRKNAAAVCGLYPADQQDGKIYEGNFRNGKFNGLGKIYHPNGIII